PRGESAPQRLVVHPGEHEDLPGVVLLHDGGHQAVGGALEACRDTGVQSGRAAAHVCKTTAARSRAGTGPGPVRSAEPPAAPAASRRPRTVEDARMEAW